MPSLGLQWLCNLENRARTRMNTVVPRIVTTGRPVVTMRVGAVNWRTNSGKVGAALAVIVGARSAGVKLCLSLTRLAQVAADGEKCPHWRQRNRAKAC